eukprot:Pgem_evm1s8889
MRLTILQFYVTFHFIFSNIASACSAIACVYDSNFNQTVQIDRSQCLTNQRFKRIHTTTIKKLLRNNVPDRVKCREYKKKTMSIMAECTSNDLSIAAAIPRGHKTQKKNPESIKITSRTNKKNKTNSGGSSGSGSNGSGSGSSSSSSASQKEINAFKLLKKKAEEDDSFTFSQVDEYTGKDKIDNWFRYVINPATGVADGGKYVYADIAKDYEWVLRFWKDEYTFFLWNPENLSDKDKAKIDEMIKKQDKEQRERFANSLSKAVAAG